MKPLFNFQERIYNFYERTPFHKKKPTSGAKSALNRRVHSHDCPLGYLNLPVPFPGKRIIQKSKFDTGVDWQGRVVVSVFLLVYGCLAWRVSQRPQKTIPQDVALCE